MTRYQRWVATCAVVLAGCGDSDDGPAGADAAPHVPDAAVPRPDAAPPNPAFHRYTVDDAVDGPAWVTPADLDGDGRLELVVSAFGDTGNLFSGDLRVYARTGDLGAWEHTVIAGDIKFPNQNSVADVDGDGDLDIVLPAGFFACAFFGGPCGAVSWFEQTDTGWERHDVVTGSARFYHRAELFDVDGDGVRDLVTVGETFAPPTTGTATAEWFKGTADGFTGDAHELGAGLGSLVQAFDIDGDGDLDLASAEFFHNDLEGVSFAWLENGGDTWTRHVIDDDSGPSIMLTIVPDLYGDAALYAVGSNHVNDQRNPPDAWPSAVFAFERPADPTQPWPKTTISEGIVSRAGDLTMNRFDAPGPVGVGDIDGDGDLDIAVSGDGDARTFWLEQRPGKTWHTHVLQDDMGQAGGMVVTDLDGDGAAEIVVTSFEADVIHVFEWSPE